MLGWSNFFSASISRFNNSPHRTTVFDISLIAHLFSVVLFDAKYTFAEAPSPIISLEKSYFCLIGLLWYANKFDLSKVYDLRGFIGRLF